MGDRVALIQTLYRTSGRFGEIKRMYRLSGIGSTQHLLQLRCTTASKTQRAPRAMFSTSLRSSIDH
jgi:hypothetical protein